MAEQKKDEQLPKPIEEAKATPKAKTVTLVSKDGEHKVEFAAVPVNAAEVTRLKALGWTAK